MASKRFFRLYKGFLEHIVDNRLLSFGDLGILVSLARFIDSKSNYLIDPKTKQRLSVSRIAKLLHVDRKHLSQCLERLSSQGFLVADRSDNGKQNAYRLNANFTTLIDDEPSDLHSSFEDIEISGRPNVPMDSQRDIVGSQLRFDVFQRDNFRCVYCGRSAADGVQLHADHIIPASKGGKTKLDNLATSCRECNLGKSDRLLASSIEDRSE